MPVILETDEVYTYLEGDIDEARDLLDPYGGEDLEMYEVSKKVNNPANDEPDIVLPEY